MSVHSQRRRDHNRNQCGGRKPKLCYDNVLDAWAAAARTERVHPDNKYTVYQCGLCGFIHVGRMHPNDIHYFEDMVIPTFSVATANGDSNRTPRSALSKKEKRAIVTRAQGLQKARYPARVFMPGRGYQPFMHLADEMFGKQCD